jgi:hypothetical protein
MSTDDIPDDLLNSNEIDHQEPECSWSDMQITAVELFKSLFNIELERHDYFKCEGDGCMKVRFKRDTRLPHESQFYTVEIAVGLNGGIYMLINDKPEEVKNLSNDQRNAIIQLYNCITGDGIEN